MVRIEAHETQIAVTSATTSSVVDNRSIMSSEEKALGALLTDAEYVPLYITQNNAALPLGEIMVENVGLVGGSYISLGTAMDTSDGGAGGAEGVGVSIVRRKLRKDTKRTVVRDGNKSRASTKERTRPSFIETVLSARLSLPPSYALPMPRLTKRLANNRAVVATSALVSRGMQGVRELLARRRERLEEKKKVQRELAELEAQVKDYEAKENGNVIQPTSRPLTVQFAKIRAATDKLKELMATHSTPPTAIADQDENAPKLLDAVQISFTLLVVPPPMFTRRPPPEPPAIKLGNAVVIPLPTAFSRAPTGHDAVVIGDSDPDTAGNRAGGMLRLGHVMGTEQKSTPNHLQHQRDRVALAKLAIRPPSPRNKDGDAKAKKVTDASHPVDSSPAVSAIIKGRNVIRTRPVSIRCTLV